MHELIPCCEDVFQFLALTNLYTTRKMSQILESSLKVKYQVMRMFGRDVTKNHFVCLDERNVWDRKGHDAMRCCKFSYEGSKFDLIVNGTSIAVSRIIYVLDFSFRIFRSNDCVHCCRIRLFDCEIFLYIFPMIMNVSVRNPQLCDMLLHVADIPCRTT